MKKKVGRPSAFTEEVIRKIEEAAALDCTVKEIAFFAGIHFDTLYAKLDSDKEFSERIEALRNNPILKSRQTIIGSLSDVENAKWYIERKRKKEFSTRTESDVVVRTPRPLLEEIEKEKLPEQKNGISNNDIDKES
jgi:hypothetical protein